ncbi:MAG: hypothetical protein LIO93_02220 [Bacteroidales bacterium]|nr:hypothetical protein [Bacteroidales bacterium]
MKKTKMFVLLFLITCSFWHLPAQTPPTLSEDGKEVWYYISSLNAAGRVMYNHETLNTLAVNPELNNDAQLWKLVAEGSDGGFKIVSKKDGAYLNYVGTRIKSTSTGAVFTLLTTTYPVYGAAYQLYYNNGSSTNGTGYVNQLTNGVTNIFEFQRTATSGAEGNAIVFLTVEEMEDKLNSYPKVSKDADEYWYYIGAKSTTSPMFLTSEGIGQEAKFAAEAQTEVSSQLWKFEQKTDYTGTISYKLINKNGGELNFASGKFSVRAISSDSRVFHVLQNLKSSDANTWQFLSWGGEAPYTNPRALLKVNAEGVITPSTATTGGLFSNEASFALREYVPNYEIGVDTETEDFGEIQVGSSSGSKEVQVSVEGITLNDVTYALEGDETQFQLDNTGWAQGKISVTYAPTELGPHSATLVFRAEGASNKYVALSGITSFPLTVSTGEEVWYYIKSLNAGGRVLYSRGTLNSLFATPERDNDAQLWKIVNYDPSTGFFELENKAGGKLDYGRTTSSGNPTARFSINEEGNTVFRLKSYQNDTFTSDQSYQLYFEQGTNSGYANQLTNGVTNVFELTRNASPDLVGNGLEFLSVAEMEQELSLYPTLSANGTAYWYLIKAADAENKVISVDADNNIVTTDYVSPSMPEDELLWKFERKEDAINPDLLNYILVNKKTGKELNYTTSGNKFVQRDPTDQDTRVVSILRNLTTNESLWQIISWTGAEATYSNRGFLKADSSGTVSAGTSATADLRNLEASFEFIAYGSTSDITNWEGALNDEWNNAGNWSNGVPEIRMDVVIQSAGNIPTVPEGTKVNNLTLESGAGLNLQGELTVIRKVQIEKTVDQYIWYPIGFPFENTGAYYFGTEDGYDEYPLLNPYAEATGGDYWLKSYDGSLFTYTSSFEAGKGYIAQYPAYFNGKKITYVSKSAPTLSNGAVVPEAENYKLVANPTWASLSLTSRGGTFYYIFDTDKFILLEEGQSATVQPFESFILISTTTPNLLKSSISGEEGFTDLEPVADPMGEIVEKRYYNLQGIRIGRPLEKEVYIEKTIYESGREITTKIVNTKK